MDLGLVLSGISVIVLLGTIVYKQGQNARAQVELSRQLKSQGQRLIRVERTLTNIRVKLGITESVGGNGVDGEDV